VNKYNKFVIRYIGFTYFVLVMPIMNRNVYYPVALLIGLLLGLTWLFFVHCLSNAIKYIKGVK